MLPVPSRRVSVVRSERGYVEIGTAGLLLIALCAFALFLYCRAEDQTVPVTGRQQKVAMSEQDQAKLGADAYNQVLRQEAADVFGMNAVAVRDLRSVTSSLQRTEIDMSPDCGETVGDRNRSAVVDRQAGAA